MEEKKPAQRQELEHARSRVKVVAEMPQDKELQSKLEEMKKNDGYPHSCG